MKFFVIGDLHGRVRDLARIDEYCARNGIATVIQVGDFGICWPGEDCSIIRYFNKRARQQRPGPVWITCLGNHDNWNKFYKNLEKEKNKRNCNTDITLVPYAPGLFATNRPAFLDIFGGMAFCGGAVSTDADYIPVVGWDNSSGHSGRIENKDWWKNEAPSQDDLQKFCDLIEEKKPKYIFTHDGPEFAHSSRGSGLCLKSNLRYDYCSRSFETISKIIEHRPTRWFFGHHHQLISTDRDNTTYHCCGLHGEGYLVDDIAGTATKINLSFSKGKKCY
jgi:Calcineurin-like phosphoesterase